MGFNKSLEHRTFRLSIPRISREWFGAGVIAIGIGLSIIGGYSLGKNLKYLTNYKETQYNYIMGIGKESEIERQRYNTELQSLETGLYLGGAGAGIIVGGIIIASIRGGAGQTKMRKIREIVSLYKYKRPWEEKSKPAAYDLDKELEKELEEIEKDEENKT